jgi:hypothetical protein
MKTVESPWLSRVREMQPPAGDRSGLTVSFEAARGERLSHLIRRRRDERRPLTVAQVYYLMREAAAAVRALHASGPGMCHGAVAASRFVLTTEGRLVLQDAVFGSALGALDWPVARLRDELGLRVPELPGIPSFTPLTDQLQLGLLALHLVTGSQADDLPSASLAVACADARLPAAEGPACPLHGDFRAVLMRTLLVSADGPFRSMLALDRALESAIAADRDNPPAPPEIELEEWTAPQVIAFSPAQPSEDPAAFLPRDGTTGEPLPPIPAWWSPPAGVSPSPAQARAIPATEPRAEPPLHSERERPGSLDLAPSPSGRPDVPASERADLFDTAPAPRPRFHSASPEPAALAPPAPASVASPIATPSPSISLAPSRATPPTRTFRWEPEEPDLDAGQPPEAYWKAKSDVFSEAEPAARPWGRIGAIAAVGVLALGLGYYLLGAMAMKALSGPTPGHLYLESKPVGATVVIGGIERGKTPLVLEVPPGSHRVEFTLGEESKAVTVSVSEGADAQQAVSLYPPGPPGKLDIGSIPAGAALFVDGRPRGKTPATIADVAPGEHVVAVESAVGRIERVVEVLAGAVVPVTLPLSGVLEVHAPFEVMVFDKARALGTTRTGRFAIAAGRRQVTFANDELQYEENREVDVPAGGVARVSLTPPAGTLDFTSDTPRETEVFLDDRPLGPTPLANVPVSLGSHVATFRHAKLGEQRYTILVSLGSPARLHAEMKAKQITVTREGKRTSLR